MVPEARTNPKCLRRLLISSDAAAIVVGIAGATVLQQLISPVSNDILVDEMLLALVIAPISVLMMGANQVFMARAISRFSEEFRHLWMAGFMSVGFLVAVSFIAQYSLLSRLRVGLLLICVTGSLIASRLIARRVFENLRRSGCISRPVVIVGTGIDATALLHATQRRPDLGYRVLGYTGDRSGERGDLRVLGSVDETLEVVRATGATGVILTVGSLDPEVVNRLTRTLTHEGCHVTLARAIKLDSRGPVLFRQERVGKDGELFEMLKLRSMCTGAEAMQQELQGLNERTGPLFKLSSDPRATRVGRFIRKTSIDELPQLWNVIRGDMSVVGPRPALSAESEQWSPDLRKRLRVLPGITGMWQVSGRAEGDFEIYRRLDPYYVHYWSLMHDVKILAKTPFVVAAGRGAH